MTAELLPELTELRARLLRHPLYAEVTSLPRLQTFMREHVFAVWDFMSLLKRLQQVVTCCDVPWLPRPDAVSARFILEIVLGEECDEDGQGGYASHFDLYLDSMRELGADAVPIEGFVEALRAGHGARNALAAAAVLDSTRGFVQFTLDAAANGPPHAVAAAFFYGREDVIPDMFSRLIPALESQGRQVDRLRHYLRRHIELDGDSHGPLAQRLLSRLCGDDPGKRREALQIAGQSLEHRLRLWDGILAAIRACPPSSHSPA